MFSFLEIRFEWYCPVLININHWYYFFVFHGKLLYISSFCVHSFAEHCPEIPPSLSLSLSLFSISFSLVSLNIWFTSFAIHELPTRLKHTNPPGGGVYFRFPLVCFENLCPLGVNIWFPRGLLMGQLLIGVYSLCYLLVFVWLTWSQLWVSPS